MSLRMVSDPHVQRLPAGRRGLFHFLLFLIAVLPPAGAAQALAPGFGKLAVAIDGEACGKLRSWRGGDPRAVLDSGAGRHVTGVEFSPLVLEFGLPLPPVVQNWIGAFCSNQPATRSIILTEMDGGGRAVASTQLNESTLSAVGFSALGGAGGTTATVTLMIKPGYRTKIGPTDIRQPKDLGTVVTSSQFRLTLPGLSGNRVGGIAAFSVTARPGGGGVDGLNLALTMAATDAKPWTEWRDAVLGFGRNPVITPVEKTMDLTYLGSNLQVALLNLHFEGVSIVAVTPVFEGGGAVPQVQIELACARMSLAAAAPVAAPPVTPAAPSSPAPAPVPTPVERTMTPAAAANTSPEDMGARDPQGFPRPAGLVRQSYTSHIVPTQARETAEYSSKLAFDSVVANFAAAARAAEWQESSRSESGNTPAQRLMMIEYRQALAVASVRIYGKDKGSAASIDVTTQTPAGGK